MWEIILGDNGGDRKKMYVTSIGPSTLQRYQHALSHQAYSGQMGSAQMASPWYPGSVGSCWWWDATCPDTFAPSYTLSATSEAGLVAAGAEERKEAKYTSLGSLHCFTPLAIETTGVLGPKSMTFVKELGGRVARVTGDQKSYYYLLQYSVGMRPR